MIVERWWCNRDGRLESYLLAVGVDGRRCPYCGGPVSAYTLYRPVLHRGPTRAQVARARHPSPVEGP